MSDSAPCWCGACDGLIAYSRAQRYRHASVNGLSRNAPRIIRDYHRSRIPQQQDSIQAAAEAAAAAAANATAEAAAAAAAEEEERRAEEEERRAELTGDEFLPSSSEEESPEEDEPAKELRVPISWANFAAAKVVWPPNQEAAPQDIAFGCLLNLLKLQALKCQTGLSVEANVMLWRSLEEEWTSHLPLKAQSMRK